MFEKNFIITDIISIIEVESENVGKMRDYSGKIMYNELVFKTEGKTKVCFDKYTFFDEKGSVRFFAKTDDTTRYTTEVKEKGNCIDVIFETSVPIEENPFSKKPKNPEKIYNLFRKAENVWRKKQPGYKFKAMGYLYEIIGAFQSENEYFSSDKTGKIKIGVDYITENFTKDIKIENVAEMCGISHTYFKKIFKSVFGVSPKNYIINLKIQYACDLIKSKKYKISEIAEMVGYKNVYYFSKSFKNVMGISPGKYK